ncbi:PACE efflux transporter [Marinobacter sp. 1Y8]
MRTPKDRIRQAVSFEAIGLILVIPLGSLIFDFSLESFGILGAIGASMATGWNYLYNLLFDRALKKWRGSTRKTLGLRFIHALVFELGLMIAFLPVVAWWLNVGLIEALVIDAAFVVFYLIYAFVFTWCYDTLFPDPDARAPRAEVDSADGRLPAEARQ